MSEDIQNWDNSHFVHPWEGVSNLGENQRTIIERGEGVYLFDQDGNKYIDGPGGMWCVQIGYGRAEMAKAISDQVGNLAYFSPFNNTNAVTTKLAYEISKRSPGDLNHIFFTTGGSTAVDTALRFVQFRNNILGNPEKKLTISRKKSYHGSTFLSATVSSRERDKLWLDKANHLVYFLSEVAPSRRPKSQTIEDYLDEKVNELEQSILKIGPQKVASFIAEPIQASGGVLIPPKGYHSQCLEVCRKYDVLYISDEVVTGFGRLGHWFASESEFEIVPDIITCAKGLTSGYLPMGATLISDRLIDELIQIAPNESTFSNGYTYSGHPVSAAAALKNIEIIENEGLLEHVQEISPIFQERLLGLSTLPLVVDTRGMGLVGCIECSRNQNFKDDQELGVTIDLMCQKKGLLIRPVVNMCILSPPLIITEDQVHKMFDILEEVISQV